MFLSPSRRVWIAYTLALRVLASYLLAWSRGAIFLRPLNAEGWTRLHGRNAARIVVGFNRLRGIYIKIGQSLSIMSNFLPEALTSGLESLQDKTPPTPVDQIESVIAKSLGKPVQALFTRFSPTPIASASLGQVHEAELPSGERVAVKVQHPYIEKIVGSDLRTLRRIFGLFHLAFPRYGIKAVFRECADMIRQELDFHREGKNCEAVAANLADLDYCRFPKIYWDYTTDKVLTAEFMAGVKINRLQTLPPADIDRREVAVRLLHAYCRQLFENGLYHADPHPGNILVAPRPADQGGPALVFLDFGATARISDKMRLGITRFVEGLIRKDVKILTEAMHDMGFVAKGDREEAVERIIEQVYSRLSGLQIENFKEMQSLQTLYSLVSPGELELSIRDLATSFHIPREWVLLERTLLIIMGTCAQLDPALNPVHIVLPYVERFVLGRDRHFNDLVVQIVKEAGLSYLNLGAELSRTLKRLEKGTLALNVKLNQSLDAEVRVGVRLIASTGLFSLCLVLLHGGAEASTWTGPLRWGAAASGLVTIYLFFKKK